ncbi:MAG: DUF4406 domain-containing protein [Clostridia bacterium]
MTFNKKNNKMWRFGGEKFCRQLALIKEGNMEKKLIYVCSPLKANVKIGLSYFKNLSNARRYCRFVYKQGAIPIAPHLYLTQFLDDEHPVERKDGMDMGLELLSICDEIWVFGNYISYGMREEISTAMFSEKPIVRKFFTSDLTPRVEVNEAATNRRITAKGAKGNGDG